MGALGPTCLRELEKLALSPAAARAAEAAIGAAAGAAAGGALGGSTYDTKTPRYYVDPAGFIRERPLLPEEKREFWKRVRTGALAGAGVGTGGSLAGSAVRRHLISKAEEKLLPQVLAQHLEPIKGLTAAERQTLRESIAADIVEFLGRRHPRQVRVEEAEKLLGSEEARIRGLLSKAREARKGRLYGGVQFAIDPTKPEGHPERWIPSPELSFQGMVRESLGPEGRKTFYGSPQGPRVYYEKLLNKLVKERRERGD